MQFALIASFVALLLLSTLVPLSHRTEWMIRDLDFPRLQIAIGAVILLVAEFFVLDLSETVSHVLIFITAACLIYQAWWVGPYSRVFPFKVMATMAGEPDDRVRILTANVLAPNRQAHQLIALIREHKPHVFVTLESDAWWHRALGRYAPELRIHHPLTCAFAANINVRSIGVACKRCLVAALKNKFIAA